MNADPITKSEQVRARLLFGLRFSAACLNSEPSSDEHGVREQTRTRSHGSRCKFPIIFSFFKFLCSVYNNNNIIIIFYLSQGTLPFRLLAAEFGADITYGEEIIDHKMVKCERRLNGTQFYIIYLQPRKFYALGYDFFFFFVAVSKI